MEGEHRVQLELLRALKEALGRSEERAAASALLAQLLEYSDAHFLSEQLLMRLHAYPAYEHHVQEHERLVDELRSTVAAWEKGAGEEVGGLLQHVEEWLLVHMTTTDTALETYLAERARKPT